MLTNDPENPRIALTLKAEVTPSVYLRPGFARFIQAQDSDPGEVEQIIFTRDIDDLKVLGVESPYPFLDAQARPATDEEKQEEGTGNQWVITLTLDYSKAPVGPLADYVNVTTNHPQAEGGEDSGLRLRPPDGGADARCAPTSATSSSTARPRPVRPCC